MAQLLPRSLTLVFRMDDFLTCKLFNHEQLLGTAAT